MIEFGIVDGVQYGVPAKADLKSLVWYQPAAFEAAGYTVPTTFDEFTALVTQITEDGGATWRKIDRFPGVPDLLALEPQ